MDYKKQIELKIKEMEGVAHAYVSNKKTIIALKKSNSLLSDRILDLKNDILELRVYLDLSITEKLIQLDIKKSQDKKM